MSRPTDLLSRRRWSVLAVFALALGACDSSSDPDPDPQPDPEPIPTTTYSPSLFAEGFGSATGVAQLADGRVAILSGGILAGTGALYTFAPDGSDRTELITGLEDGLPSDVVQLTDGRLLVVEDSRILAFNADGSGQAEFATGLLGARGIIQLADGRVLVVESNDAKATTFNADGSGRATFASGLSTPQFATQLADGRILISEFQTGRVTGFNADGSGRSTFATIRSTNSVAQLSDGRILVTGSDDSSVGDDEIYAFSASGTPLGVFATGLNGAYDMMRLADGRILVSELGAGRATVFTEDVAP